MNGDGRLQPRPVAQMRNGAALLDDAEVGETGDGGLEDEAMSDGDHG